MSLPTAEWLEEQILSRLAVEGRVRSEDAGPIARTVLAYFGKAERILDPKLSSDDRGRFYLLEEIGVLRCDTEEVTVGKGRSWRVHWWTFTHAPAGSYAGSTLSPSWQGRELQ